MVSRYEKIQKHLSQAENRIRYCYHFMTLPEYECKGEAFERAMYWIAQVEDEEAHY